MNHTADSSYGRLNAAWLGESSVRPTFTLARGAAATRSHRQGEAAGNHYALTTETLAPRILVARCGRRPPPAFDCGLLSSTTDEERIYRVDPVSVDSLGDLERCCRAGAPRVLLIDLALVRGCDPQSLLHLHRRIAAADWLVASDRPVTGSDAALVGWARGCVSWGLDGDTLTHALDAVLAGRLWFPRAVLEALYLELRAAGDGAAAPAEPHPAGAGLSGREAEVLALMRQGLSNKQIAERLGISVNTIKKHLAHAFEKRGLCKRRQALA